MEGAVIAFQTRRGLNLDGIVGHNTLRAPNIPVKKRIDHIRVNLERMRWVYRNLPDDCVLVDIDSYKVYLVRNGLETWQGRAKFGLPNRHSVYLRDTTSKKLFERS